MIHSLFVVVALGVMIGGAFGRYYSYLYNLVYSYVYKIFRKLANESFSVVAAFLVAVMSVFVFSIWGLIFTHFISLDLRSYYTNSFFVGVVVGMVFLRLARRK